MLFILNEEDKPRTHEDYDTIVSAELPDKKMFPQMFQVVSKHMIHGLCGSCILNTPCMNEGKCTKCYPKEYQTTTSDSKNGYPLYRRSENGKTVTIKGVKLDNRWVVHYNPYLVLK